MSTIKMSCVNKSVSPPLIFQCAQISTTSVLDRRMGKRIRVAPEWKRINLSKGPWWKKDPIVMTSPLARTQHPESMFSKIEEDLSKAVAEKSEKDFPVDIDDPYAPEPTRCILCPSRYTPGHAPTPSYLNPKLLSQFTSPHTGLVYEKHITGLCTKMQEKVEKEVRRSQGAGLMSTKVKNVEYLQDPQIVKPAKPYMPNPF